MSTCNEHVNQLKITAVIKHVTVEELGAMMTFLRDYRKNKAS